MEVALLFVGASASVPPLSHDAAAVTASSVPPLSHHFLSLALPLLPANATAHRRLKSAKAKGPPLPKRLQKTYPECNGHADDVAGKRAADAWDKCKNNQVGSATHHGAILSRNSVAQFCRAIL